MPAPMQGPLGQYGIARSLVQTPGWKALEAEQNEMLPGGGGGGGGFGMRIQSGRPMTNEERVRAYGYEGALSQMQDNIPPSLRGIESAPNAGVMLSAAAANVKSGRYKDMNEAMQAQIDFNKKYPGYGIEENIRLTKASHDLVKDAYGTTKESAAAHNKSMLKGHDTLYDYNKSQKLRQATAGSLINANQGQVGSWTPGGSYQPTANPTQVIKAAPLARRTLGSSVAARNVPRVTGRPGSGGGASTSSARRSYSSRAASARNNFRGL